LSNVRERATRHYDYDAEARPDRSSVQKFGQPPKLRETELGQVHP
jgi:hypothetical protein